MSSSGQGRARRGGGNIQPGAAAEAGRGWRSAQYLHRIRAVFEFGLPAEGWCRRGDSFSRGVAVDPADPPKFESEASYLARHKLFLPGERARLCPRDFWPERIEP